ncbi:MAG TPA: hypothetical protein VLE95_04590 [Chlamydiales bacterium]|nr:hypothetical protein [Chlamydiales bacterium]
MTGLVSWTFQDDYQNLISSCDAHASAVNQQTEDAKNYHNTVIEQMNKYLQGKNPELALIYFLYVVMASTNPDNNANILGLAGDQTNVLGQAMSASAGETRLSTDLQNLFSDNISTSSVPENMQVGTMNNAVGQLIDVFTNPLNKDYASVVGSFDASSRSSIVQQLKSIQGTMQEYFSPTNADGTLNAQPSGKEDGLDNENPPKLMSFHAMNTNMSSKDDVGHAVEASKQLTQAFQTLGSITQNINAALNQQVSQATAFTQNEQAFYSSLMKSTLDMINQNVNNQVRG